MITLFQILVYFIALSGLFGMGESKFIRYIIASLILTVFSIFFFIAGIIYFFIKQEKLYLLGVCLVLFNIIFFLWILLKGQIKV